MGDNDGRARGFQTLQGLPHRRLIDRVEMRSRLIQDQHRRVFQERPRDGDTLALAAGQAGTAFADRGFQTLRQGGDQVAEGGVVDGGGQLRAARLGLGDHDIGPERVVE